MAGTITFTQEDRGEVRRIIATCTADAADGSFPATALPAFQGTIVAVVTDPGSPAPTDNYDFTLVDGNGLDRLNGAGQNRDTVNSERIRTNIVVDLNETLTLTPTGNSVNSAVLVITFVYSPEVQSGGQPLTAATASVTNQNDQATNVTLLQANGGRKGVVIVNDSTATLYLKYGATASTTSFTYRLDPGVTWEMPQPLYTGQIDGIWSVDASGAARITELT